MSLGVIWFCLGVAFLVGEVLTMSFILFFFSIGSFAASIFSLFNNNSTLALLIFSFASVLSLLFFRSKVLAKLRGHNHQTYGRNDIAYPLSEKPSQAGRTGIVTKEVLPNAVGEISLGGSFWRATSHETLPEGASVRVIGHDPENEILLHVARFDQYNK